MRTTTLIATALLATAPAWALYKVVGPDGRVTYTDKAPSADTASHVSSVRTGQSPPADGGMPFELREPIQKYPVTLYTSTECVPCDSARQLLLLRGIPFAEKRLSTEQDARAYDQLGGGRTVPGLSIGSQQLRGLNTTEWNQYLDAAGYPKESRLPKGWTPPPVTPLVEIKPLPAPAAEATRQPSSVTVRRPSPPPAQPSSGIRF